MQHQVFAAQHAKATRLQSLAYRRSKHSMRVCMEYTTHANLVKRQFRKPTTPSNRLKIVRYPNVCLTQGEKKAHSRSCIQRRAV